MDWKKYIYYDYEVFVHVFPLFYFINVKVILFNTEIFFMNFCA